MYLHELLLILTSTWPYSLSSSLLCTVVKRLCLIVFMTWVAYGNRPLSESSYTPWFNWSVCCNHKPPDPNFVVADWRVVGEHSGYSKVMYCL